MMSDVTYAPLESNVLIQRLQSAEKSIAFIQREHAATLTNLHEEIAKWQQKCSGKSDEIYLTYSHRIWDLELTFQLAIGGGTIVNSIDDSKFIFIDFS